LEDGAVAVGKKGFAGEEFWSSLYHSHNFLTLS
jgi:hypothetical protein